MGGWVLVREDQHFSCRANFLFFHEKRFVKFCKEMYEKLARPGKE